MLEDWWSRHREVWIWFEEDHAPVEAACLARAQSDPLAVVTADGVVLCESAEEREWVRRRLADVSEPWSAGIVAVLFDRGCLRLEFESAASSERQLDFVRWVLGRFTVAGVRNELGADLLAAHRRPAPGC